MKTNNTQDEISIGANEYCSNQDLLIPLEMNNTASGMLDRSAQLSQTMNRKVGHYL